MRDFVKSFVITNVKNWLSLVDEVKIVEKKSGLSGNRTRDHLSPSEVSYRLDQQTFTSGRKENFKKAQ